MTPPRSTCAGALIVLVVLLWLAARAYGATDSMVIRLPTHPAPSTDEVDYRAYVQRWEGYRTRPYRDGPGWSVGVGHSLTAHGERAIWDRPYTRVEIERHLLWDMAAAIDACRKGITRFDTLPLDVRQVCVGVAFTVGRTGFERFVGFRLAIGYRAWNGAATELGLSRWASQVSVERFNHCLRVLRSQP